MKRLPTFPDRPAHSMRVRIGGDTVRYRRVWHPRLQAWFVDIRTTEGEPIMLGRRVTVDSVLSGMLAVPLDATIWVRGPDGYNRDDLGETLREIVAEPDDLPESEERHLDEFIEEIET